VLFFASITIALLALGIIWDLITGDAPFDALALTWLLLAGTSGALAWLCLGNTSYMPRFLCKLWIAHDRMVIIRWARSPLSLPLDHVSMATNPLCSDRFGTWASKNLHSVVIFWRGRRAWIDLLTSTELDLLKGLISNHDEPWPSREDAFGQRPLTPDQGDTRI
jgi:hypothetical protein